MLLFHSFDKKLDLPISKLASGRFCLGAFLTAVRKIGFTTILLCPRDISQWRSGIKQKASIKPVLISSGMFIML